MATDDVIVPKSKLDDFIATIRKAASERKEAAEVTAERVRKICDACSSAERIHPTHGMTPQALIERLAVASVTARS